MDVPLTPSQHAETQGRTAGNPAANLYGIGGP